MFERNLRIKCIALELANIPDMSFLRALASCIVLAKAYGACSIVRLNSSFWTHGPHWTTAMCLADNSEVRLSRIGFC
jgi:hypothetical protein